MKKYASYFREWKLSYYGTFLYSGDVIIYGKKKLEKLAMCNRAGKPIKRYGLPAFLVEKLLSHKLIFQKQNSNITKTINR